MDADEQRPAASTGMGRQFLMALNIHPEEVGRTASLFAYLFLASVVFTVGRTARDALFLSQFPVKWLPWMSVGFGVSSALISPVYAPLAQKFRRDSFNAIFAAAVAGSYVAAWILARHGWRPVFPTLYIWVEVTNNLLIVQFWTLANDLHDAREAKRLFGVIGSSRMIGIVACGLAVGALVGFIGTASLLLVNAAVLLCIAVLVAGFGKKYVKQSQGVKVISAHAPPAQTQWSSPYILWILAMIGCTYIAATIGDYQFKVIAREHYTGEKLAAYFALFYGVTGAVAFFFHFFASSRLLGVFGMAAGLLVMPLFMAGSSGWLWASGGMLLAATAIKFSDNAFQFTINDSALQLLYYPFPDSIKTRLKAVLEGAIKPLAYGAGGLVLILLAAKLGPVHLAWIVLPVIATWVMAVLVLRRLYLKALVDSLAQRRLEAGTLEIKATPEVIKALSQAVRTGTELQAEFALSELKSVAPDAATELLEELLEDPGRRHFAVIQLAGMHGHAERLKPLLKDCDEEIRIAAIQAYASMAHEDAIEDLAPFLLSKEPREADAACVALVQHAGVEGVLAAAEHLKHLLKGNARERARAAQIVGKSKVRAFGRTLRKLLRDDSPEVHRTALSAAGGLKSRKLLPDLLIALADPRQRALASASIEVYGDRALKPLAEALGDSRFPIESRIRIPRFIRRINHPDVVGILWAHVSEADEDLRAQVLHHVARLQERWRLAIDRREVVRLLEVEGRAAALWLGYWQGLETGRRDVLLAEALEHRISMCARRVFSLLRVIYGSEVITRIRAGLESGDRTRAATALETLDNLLGRREREWIVPLADARAREESVKVLRQRFAVEYPAPASAWLALLEGSTPYLAAVALRIHPDPASLGSIAEKLLAGGQEIVLEELYRAWVRTGAGILPLENAARTRDLPRLKELIESKKSSTEGKIMLTTLERVLFLKSVPLFGQVLGEDLAGLAQEGQVKDFASGERVFSAGDPGDSLYLIIKGKARVHLEEKTLATLGEGECFGEMAILDNAPRSASVTAAEPLQTLCITQEDFFEILSDRPEISRGVFAVLTARLRKADEEIRRLSAA